MQLPYQTYTLRLTDKTDDSHPYDHHHQPDTHHQATSTCAIHVSQHGTEIANARVSAGGGATAIHATCALIDGEKLVLCCGNSVFCLQLPTLELIWHTQADDATCFQIVPYQDDYLIHGEIFISRLDQSGRIVWQFSGKDIFVSSGHSVEKNFRIEPDGIALRDFMGNSYRINFDGQLMI